MLLGPFTMGEVACNIRHKVLHPLLCLKAEIWLASRDISSNEKAQCNGDAGEHRKGCLGRERSKLREEKLSKSGSEECKTNLEGLL